MKSYFSCENGVYKNYPYGYMDASATYYNRYGSEIGRCNSWVAGPTCALAEETAGECRPVENLSIGFAFFLLLHLVQSLF